MSLITKMRRQQAVYWSVPEPDGLGSFTFGPAVQIGCRWETTNERRQDKQGVDYNAKAKVYVDRAIDLGGYLWLGKLTDLPAGLVRKTVWDFPLFWLFQWTTADGEHQCNIGFKETGAYDIGEIPDGWWSGQDDDYPEGIYPADSLAAAFEHTISSPIDLGVFTLFQVLDLRGRTLFRFARATRADDWGIGSGTVPATFPLPPTGIIEGTYGVGSPTDVPNSVLVKEYEEVPNLRNSESLRTAICG